MLSVTTVLTPANAVIGQEVRVTLNIANPDSNTVNVVQIDGTDSTRHQPLIRQPGPATWKGLEIAVPGNGSVAVSYTIVPHAATQFTIESWVYTAADHTIYSTATLNVTV